MTGSSWLVVCKGQVLAGQAKQELSLQQQHQKVHADPGRSLPHEVWRLQSSQLSVTWGWQSRLQTSDTEGLGVLS